MYNNTALIAAIAVICYWNTFGQYNKPTHLSAVKIFQKIIVCIELPLITNYASSFIYFVSYLYNLFLIVRINTKKYQLILKLNLFKNLEKKCNCSQMVISRSELNKNYIYFICATLHQDIFSLSSNVYCLKRTSAVGSTVLIKLGLHNTEKICAIDRWHEHTFNRPCTLKCGSRDDVCYYDLGIGQVSSKTHGCCCLIVP